MKNGWTKKDNKSDKDMIEYKKKYKTQKVI